ncbi:uncharacterized protein Z518_00930 [Rhinocladiella mackenziei CBS 650.93]|uniref:Methyltransferase n=1 Tax=Rhinocladiella mackenziei CBS 650.93 TaxID=1442369 RepID=A0A0D2IUS2_9EURO|nr:uncharacterized protein Z518_00930 [Rhinocladiella mackenziei CBS 650.93]KIX09849.1 hypothetical protein Z518_00930 [Rhinocladiella mackenziei CBS 650.93]
MDEMVHLTYIKDDPELYIKERPFSILAELPEGFPETNITYELGPLQVITDIRGWQNEFNLEEHGFAFRTWQPPAVVWDDEEDIDESYVPAVKELVREMIGEDVVRIELFDWRLRNSQSRMVIDDPNSESSPQMVKIAPARVVHVDQSPAGVFDRMHRYLGEEADVLARKYRIRLINVWKPMVDVVEDMPLALCDARVATEQDLVEVDFVLEDYNRRTYMAKYTDRFKFYYMSRMTKDEVIMFKVFDSADVAAKYVPHAAFSHTHIPPSTKPRESIEVRLLVMTEE